MPIAYPRRCDRQPDPRRRTGSLTLSCPDGPGIVHAVAARWPAGGNITESQQFGDPDTGLFFMRVQVEASASGAPSSRPLLGRSRSGSA